MHNLQELHTITHIQIYFSVIVSLIYTIFTNVHTDQSIHENAHISINYIYTLYKPGFSTIVIVLSAIHNDTSHLRNLTNRQ